MSGAHSNEEKYLFVERYFSGEKASQICATAGIARSTFYTWIKPYQTKRVGNDGVASGAEYFRMKKRVAKLEEIVAILKKVNCNVSSERKDKLEALATLYGQFSVRALCEALEVPRGTFYNHVLRNKRTNNSYQARRDCLCELIEKVFEESNQIYGAKKIRAILVDCYI